jgi:hypothetical protein
MATPIAQPDSALLNCPDEILNNIFKHLFEDYHPQWSAAPQQPTSPGTEESDSIEVDLSCFHVCRTFQIHAKNALRARLKQVGMCYAYACPPEYSTKALVFPNYSRLRALPHRQVSDKDSQINFLRQYGNCIERVAIEDVPHSFSLDWFPNLKEVVFTGDA